MVQTVQLPIVVNTESGMAQLAMAVVVQKMVNAEVSGVMFTRNPTGGDELVIESKLGFGRVRCFR